MKDQAGNTRGTARRLALRPNFVVLRDGVGRSDPADYYVFTLKQRRSLSVILNGLRQDANLHLLNRRGKRLQGSTRRGKQSEFIYRNVEAGTYYLRVVSVKGETSYRLRLAAMGDRAGDTLAAAYNLGELGETPQLFHDWVGLSDPNDFFRLSLRDEPTTPERDRYQLALGLEGLSSSATLQILSASGIPIQTVGVGHTATGARQAARCGCPLCSNKMAVAVQQAARGLGGSLSVALEAGEYYLRVLPWGRAIGTPYQLTASAQRWLPPTITPPTEPPITPPPNEPGLVFNITTSAPVSSTVQAALAQAGELWANRFTDSVTVNTLFRFSDEPAGAASTLVMYSYDAVRAALTLDRTSSEDAIAVSHLPTTSALSLLVNNTSDNPNGVGSNRRYLDNDGGPNNTTIRMTTTNAKALGLDLSQGTPAGTFLGGDPAYDLVIILPEGGLGGLPWDFDRSDGISPNTVDFIGIVAHEIAHAMGFASGVDVLDRSDILPDDSWTWINTLDLFRFSSESLSYGRGTLDWSASTTDKYLSMDGGLTPLASFGTGIVNGDGIYPGHWNANASGMMSPNLAPFMGQAATISELDQLTLDLIGWDRA